MKDHKVLFIESYVANYLKKPEINISFFFFLDELYAWLTRIINQTSLEDENNINYLLLNVLLGGHAVQYIDYYT